MTQRADEVCLLPVGDELPPVRVDAIAVRFDRAGRLLAIDHIENAIEAG